MEYKWDLKKYYKSINDQKYQQDFKVLSEKLEYFLQWQKDNLTKVNTTTIQKMITLNNEISMLSGHLYNYLSLAESTDSTNPIYQSEIEKLVKKLNEYTILTINFNQYIKEIKKYPEEIEKLDLPNKKYLKNLIDKSKYVLDEKSEMILSNLSITGKNAWITMYDQITSELTFEIKEDGKKITLPISASSKYLLSNDRSLRSQVYDSVSKARLAIKTPAASALNAIKGETLYMTKLRGYESILDRVFKNSRIQPQIVEAMFKAIRENKKEFQKYLKVKAKLLGVNKLAIHDISAPIGQINRKFKANEANQIVINSFAAFSEQKANVAKLAIENNWIDYFPGNNKRQGAFCSTNSYTKESRILLNFNETISDVLTLAHELGHAYHGQVLKDEPHHLKSYSLPLAETASNFAELLVNDYFKTQLTTSELITLLDNSIFDNMLSTFIISIRYQFEDEVIKLRQEKTISADELIKLEKAIYAENLGPIFDLESFHGVEWIKVLHHYHTDYYNFPYAFGCLFARGLFAKYKQNPAQFVKTYDEILKLTGYEDTLAIGKDVNIDFASLEFWQLGLETINQEIEDLVKYTEE